MRFYELAIFVSVVLLCQVGVYYIQAWRCNKKLSPKNGNDLTILIVTDVHLLGKRRRSVVERMWVDWQMHAAARAAVDVHAPEIALVLGDQFDEGGPWTSSFVWDEYARRFFRVFAHFLPLKTLYVVGNHDTSFGRDMRLQDLQRFEIAFGPSNYVKNIEGHTFVTLNTMALDSDVASQDVRIEARSFLESINFSQLRTNKSSKVILLTHLPLFRVDDLQCGDARLREVGHVTYEAPNFRYKTHHHVLSKELSRELLAKVQPDLVLSGHTHAWCAYNHTNALEYTIPTFSWGQRPDPSYALLRFSHTHEPIITACDLPHETFVFVVYGVTASIILQAHVIRLVLRLRARKVKKTKGV